MPENPKPGSDEDQRDDPNRRDPNQPAQPNQPGRNASLAAVFARACAVFGYRAGPAKTASVWVFPTPR